MTLRELQAAGFDVDAVAYERLARFVRYLLEENERVNLTAARSAAELWAEHVCDSLALLRPLREQHVARLLDLGSGGGLPGIPLACACPRVEVTLLDATKKKVAALQRMIARLELPNACAVWGRAETLAHDPTCRERFDAVTARAVASLPALLEYAAGFVRPGGYGWFFKSAAGARTEQTAAASAARTCVLANVNSLTYRLPGESTDRVIVGYGKLGPLPDYLPRRPGRAKKRPL